MSLLVFAALLLNVGIPEVQSNGKYTHRDNYPDVTKPVLSQAYVNLPLAFEINQGQFRRSMDFAAHAGGMDIYLASGEINVVMNDCLNDREPKPPVVSKMAQAHAITRNHATKSGVIKIKFLKIKGGKAIGLDELRGTVNYFVGKNPEDWHTNVKTYRRVKYEGIYPGIDQIFYGNGEQLEYDFVVAPRANPRALEFKVSGQTGLMIDGAGDLVLHTANSHQIRFHKPIAYQEIGRARREVSVRYVVKNDQQVGFEIGAYDPTKQLVIDPLLSYSTYLGGSGNDAGFDIAVDASGSAYVTGSTDSSQFSALSGTNAFVAKLSPDGTQRTYLAILGGTGDDTAFSIAVDSNGAAYVTGATDSIDFPTTNSFQASFGGGSQDAFITKLSSTGSSVVYSTYFGGGGNDTGFAIAIDSAGGAYVAGSTDSPDLSTVGNSDAYVTKLSSSGDTRVYFSILGGVGNDTPFDIAVDGEGSAYITGSTDSADFTTANALQPNFGGGQDAFVAKLNASGAVAYSTYFGGSGTDSGFGIAVDGAGTAYVTGAIGSPEFSSPDSNNVFIAKFMTAGNELAYLNIFGGSGDDAGFAIAVDGGGNAYVTGSTSSINFTTATPIQASFGGSQDVFVAKLNTSGATLAYSTYLGGDANEAGFAITLDAAGNVYVTGFSSSNSFPTATPYQSVSGGSGDAFVLKIGSEGVTVLLTTSSGSNVTVQGNGVKATFQTVMTTGSTSITTVPATSVSGLPPGFQLFADSIALNISTTATTQGPINICFSGYSTMDSLTFGRLRILHSETGAWVNRTVTSDYASRTVCTTVPAIGQFVVVLLGPPTALIDSSSSRAAALNSVTLLRDPVGVVDIHNFSSDQRARLSFFVQSVDLLPAESLSMVTAQARDAQNVTYPLTVEAVVKVPNLEWLSQIVVKLPDGLIGKGDVQVSVTVRGVQSQPVTVRVQ